MTVDTPDAPISNFETNTGSFARRGGRPGAEPPRPEMKRRVMDIEDVLIWAFRDELPKGFRAGGGLDNLGYPSTSPMFSMVETGGRVDNWSREPGFPAAMGDPHPDALLVAAAVERLERFAGQAVDEDIGLMSDMAFDVDEAAAMRKALPRAASIVTTTAKTGKRPFWTKNASFRALCGDNGRPIVRAWQTLSSEKFGGGTVEHEELVPVAALRNGGYARGAHCILRYTPDSKEIAEERADYAVWWAALDTLANDLNGKLATIAVLQPSAAQRPWQDQQDEAKPPRLFEDLSSRIYKTQARQTAEAYRMLGARRGVGLRGVGAPHFAPRRIAAAQAATA